jgi:hypothetical protein
VGPRPSASVRSVRHRGVAVPGSRDRGPG